MLGVSVHPHTTVVLLIGDMRPNFMLYKPLSDFERCVYARQKWAPLSLRLREAEKNY